MQKVKIVIQERIIISFSNLLLEHEDIRFAHLQRHGFGQLSVDKSRHFSKNSIALT